MLEILSTVMLTFLTLHILALKLPFGNGVNLKPQSFVQGIRDVQEECSSLAPTSSNFSMATRRSNHLSFLFRPSNNETVDKLEHFPNNYYNKCSKLA
jgi:hypothetical protein